LAFRSGADRADRHGGRRELWALSKEGADHVRATATAMPGITLTEGALEVSNVDAGDTLISRLQTLGEDFETEVEGWQVDRVRDQLGPVATSTASIIPRRFRSTAASYTHGLAALARRAGVRIYEETPVVSIDPSGIRKRVVTPSAAVARFAHRARRQRPSRRAVAAIVRDVAAVCVMPASPNRSASGWPKASPSRDR